MVKFPPSFSFKPPPRFVGDSTEGLTAWIEHRDALIDRGLERRRSDRIKQIVEDHHDLHARTIYPPYPPRH